MILTKFANLKRWKVHKEINLIFTSFLHQRCEDNDVVGNIYDRIDTINNDTFCEAWYFIASENCSKLLEFDCGIMKMKLNFHWKLEKRLTKLIHQSKGL